MQIDLLKSIPATFHERRWMKAAKAWRCIFLLPLGRGELVPVLSGMIDRQFKVEIRNEELTVEIDPAQIIDVPVKGKNAQLWIETVHEGQNGLGPLITAMVGTVCEVTVSPMGQREEKKEPARGDVTEHELRGLHVAFFPKPEFHRFIEELTGQNVRSPEECKAVFKNHLGVKSCTELSSVTVKDVVRQFNVFLQGRN